MCNHARIAQSLYGLTRQGAPFNWIAICEQAFNKLKARLLTSPILVYQLTFLDGLSYLILNSLLTYVAELYTG